MAAATPIGTVSLSSSAQVGATYRDAASMASGSDGHWPTQDRVSSSASHGGLDARICAVADTSPSLRSTSAEYWAASAAGAVSGEPVHGGQGGQHRDGARPGGPAPNDAATAAPMDTPPTAIGPSRAALSSSSVAVDQAGPVAARGVTTTAPTSCRAPQNAR